MKRNLLAERGNITVTNLSQGGLGFKICSLFYQIAIKPELLHTIRQSVLNVGSARQRVFGANLVLHYLDVCDIVKVNFALDDAKRSIISRKVEVKRIDGQMVRVEFCDPKAGTALGFYLMC